MDLWLSVPAMMLFDSSLCSWDNPCVFNFEIDLDSIAYQVDRGI